MLGVVPQVDATNVSGDAIASPNVAQERSVNTVNTSRESKTLRQRVSRIRQTLTSQISDSTDSFLGYWLGPQAAAKEDKEKYRSKEVNESRGAGQTQAEPTSAFADLKYMPTIIRILADTGKFNVRDGENDPVRKNNIHEHLRTVSLICLTATAVLVALVYLRNVIVPLLLAGFFMCQLEPILFGLLNPASIFKSCSQRAAIRARRLDYSRVRALSARADGSRQENVACSDGATCWKLQAAFALLACLFVVLFLIALIVYLIWRSLEGFSFQKYADSQRLRDFTRMIKKFHGEVEEFKDVDEELDWGALLKWLNDGAVFQGLFEVTLAFFGTVFLTVLFLAFLLISDLSRSEYDEKGLKRKARLSVTRYVRIKTQVSLVVALCIWALFEILQVDLAFFFAFLTYILNHIPHIGYAIAILVPLPFVFFDPDKTMTDFMFVIVGPVIIHGIFSFVVEPKLLGKYLDLHPFVVLISFIFWTVCWGAVGAILSVPLTSVFRLVLLEWDHPYAVIMVGMLEGQRPTASRKVALGPIKVRKTHRVMEIWMSSASPSGSIASPFKETPVTPPSDSLEVLSSHSALVSTDAKGVKPKED